MALEHLAVRPYRGVKISFIVPVSAFKEAG